MCLFFVLMIFAVNGVGSKLFLEPLMVFNKYFHNGIRWSFNTEKEVVLFFVRLSGSLMIKFNPMFLNLLYISSSLSQLISSSKRHLPLQQRKSVHVSILFLTFSLLPFFSVCLLLHSKPSSRLCEFIGVVGEWRKLVLSIEWLPPPYGKFYAYIKVG